MNPLKLLDQFIPGNILAANDLTLLTRARVLVAFSVMYLVSTFFIAITIAIVNLMGFLTLWSGVASSTVSGCLYACQLFYFKRSGNMRVATHFFLAILTTATVAFITITAGWESPVVMILMCVSTCAFLMQGRHTGFIWSGIISFIYVVYYVLYQFSVELPQVVEPSLLELLKLFSWIYAFAIMFGGVVLYSSMANQLSSTLNAEREQLRQKATYDSISGAYKREAFVRILQERVADCDRPGKAFVVLDIEIMANGLLSREDEVDIQVKTRKGIERAFPGRTIIAKSSGLSFLVIVDQANNDGVTAKIIEFTGSVLEKVADPGLLAITIGAVMVPGYSADVDEIMTTARRAIQEARHAGLPYVLYSQSRRIRVEKWAPRHWTRARFSEVIQHP